MKFKRRGAMFLLAVALLVSSAPQSAKAAEGAEVFDIAKGEVVRTIENSSSLQDLVKGWLSSAGELAGSLNIEPGDGIAIKVPMTPPYPLQKEWIMGTVTEVVLFIGRSPKYEPTLLVLTRENQMAAVRLKEQNLEKFLKDHKLYSTDLNLRTDRDP
jgi:hypothetical protein